MEQGKIVRPDPEQITRIERQLKKWVPAVLATLGLGGWIITDGFTAGSYDRTQRPASTEVSSSPNSIQLAVESQSLPECWLVELGIAGRSIANTADVDDPGH